MDYPFRAREARRRALRLTSWKRATPEAARGLGVLVEVGFSLIPVNQGVWGRAPTAGGPRWRRNRKTAIRVKNKTYMTERIRKARSPYFVQYYPNKSLL